MDLLFIIKTGDKVKSGKFNVILYIYFQFEKYVFYYNAENFIRI